MNTRNTHITAVTATKMCIRDRLSDWLMEDKYYNKVKAAFTSGIAEKFFVTGELMKLLDDHKAGKAKNMQKIWSFYSFIVWYDQFFVKN